MNKENKVEIEPAGKGWWIIVFRDGLENRWPVTYEELVALRKILVEDLRV